jgi:kinesin family protein 1
LDFPWDLRFTYLATICASARVAGGSGGIGGSVSEAVFDPTIPATKQLVTYLTKDGQAKTVSKAELQEQLESREKLMDSLNETWEQKMRRTQEIQKEREQALEELGITVDKNHVGVHTPKKVYPCSHRYISC